MNLQVTYDRETDSLVITLRDAPIRESDEVRAGVIADFGEDGGWSASRFCVPRESSRTPSKSSSRRPADDIRRHQAARLPEVQQAR